MVPIPNNTYHTHINNTYHVIIILCVPRNIFLYDIIEYNFGKLLNLRISVCKKVSYFLKFETLNS